MRILNKPFVYVTTCCPSCPEFTREVTDTQMPLVAPVILPEMYKIFTMAEVQLLSYSDTVFAHSLPEEEYIHSIFSIFCFFLDTHILLTTSGNCVILCCC